MKGTKGILQLEINTRIESMPTNLKRFNFFIAIVLHAQEEQEISKSCAQAGDLLANF